MLPQTSASAPHSSRTGFVVFTTNALFSDGVRPAACTIGVESHLVGLSTKARLIAAGIGDRESTSCTGPATGWSSRSLRGSGTIESSTATT